MSGPVIPTGPTKDRSRPHHPTPEELADEVWEDESPAAVRSAEATDGGAVRQADPFVAPVLRDLRVGIDAAGWRTEHDSLGQIDVPADRYWGAQAQRSLEHFPIGSRHMPIDVVHAYGYVKQAAALANVRAGRLVDWKGAAIARACAELRAGLLDEHFPLSVYQTGSGTHTHANVNEVIANRANQLLGHDVGTRRPVDPSDDVNAGQSTNDTFITAMHVSLVLVLDSITLPGVDALIAELEVKAREWRTVAKVGRTHLMDATPLTAGQEWSGHAAALAQARDALATAVGGLHAVALGGTAVGTGLNAPAGFAESAVAELARLTGQPFRRAANPFAAQATMDEVMRAHAAIKGVAVALFKIANDLRWLASGPREGLGELGLPENEPGSTMMPGKVNPTQSEATMMACLRVFGNDVTVTMAGSEGNFQLNAFRPVAIDAALESARLMGDAPRCLGRFLVRGATINRARLARGVERSAMAATALAPLIGHDRAATIARYAVQHDVDLIAAAAHFGVDPSVVGDALRNLYPGSLATGGAVAHG